MQTDDTLEISNSKFIELEQTALKAARFLAKELEFLTAGKPMAFNRALMTLDSNNRSILV